MLDETRESFRKVADMISHQAKEQSIRSVVVTGVTPRCGTTTTAVAIAKELASLAGLRTLLVDLNVRRPGVARLLQKEVSSPMAWDAIENMPADGKVGTSSSVPRLSILSAPANAAVSAELVRSINERAAKCADIVLFDTPPLLGYADAFVAAGMSQGMVLVVEAGQTPFEVIDRVKHEVGVRGVTLLGAVLNKHRRIIPGWIYRIFAR
ncbi:CpsD/CapB family tyrosine-protein kinase [bacterium]|nr:CpsD/CapB family tyrosine-protein kinase [bacterium]